MCGRRLRGVNVSLEQFPGRFVIPGWWIADKRTLFGNAPLVEPKGGARGPAFRKLIGAEVVARVD